MALIAVRLSSCSASQARNCSVGPGPCLLPFPHRTTVIRMRVSVKTVPDPARQRGAHFVGPCVDLHTARGPARRFVYVAGPRFRVGVRYRWSAMTMSSRWRELPVAPVPLVSSSATVAVPAGAVNEAVNSCQLVLSPPSVISSLPSGC